MKILDRNPCLTPYKADLLLRQKNYKETKKALLKRGQRLKDIAKDHLYFGLHKTGKGWIYREWAPGAEKMYLTGDFCDWDRHAYLMTKCDNGVFELILPIDLLRNGQKILAIVVHNGQEFDRIPAYATRVVQEPETGAWNAVVHTMEKFPWTDNSFMPQKELFIYECHIGMAQEEGKVGTYAEFRDNVLPRVKALGYNTLQIMAVMEHPYYASFGYQVCNFYAASSRFGTPEDLKSLINTAHEMGIAVLLDVVHSHACSNTRDGLNEFDGTDHQYFHKGSRGDHSAWGTKCFNYGKHEVIRFLLSNLRFWMEEYHFDGFRFDGVTSMLYRDHGLGSDFMNLDSYFSLNTDVEAVTYLQLATDVVHQVNPNAILIAEDVSAMPGLCLPCSEGGIGFDYRLAMGVPDMWIKLLKEVSDENWDLGHIYFELTNRWPGEKVIGYCESHDQALVGDKTIMFRLCDQEMYWSMSVDTPSIVIDRGMAMHKILRLLTMTLGGSGYLTFMGNEFGHPEWIDFPREGNDWSYHYCRRQWSLVDNEMLKYQYLNRFEQDMVALAKEYHLLEAPDYRLFIHQDDKVLAYEKGDLLIIMNLNTTRSFDGYKIPLRNNDTHQVILSTDDHCYGGHWRVARQNYTPELDEHGNPQIQLYLPNRTAIIMKRSESNGRKNRTADKKKRTQLSE